MTQRTMRAGQNQTIVIKVGGSVTVKGYESDLITADTKDRWGLTLERKNAAEVARARAAVGEHVLFDLRVKLPGKDKEGVTKVIEVNMGGSGEVLVPNSSNLKLYAGKDIEAQGIRGQVDAYAGRGLKLSDVDCLGNASAGGAMDLDCRMMRAEEATFNAGSDFRFHISDLTSARIRVNDLGGYWEARIGTGEKSVYLKAGGDVTLVTNQAVEPLPPHYILGKIEKPAV